VSLGAGARPVHPIRDAGLSDLKAELEQLAMDAWRAPQRIVNAHPSDQCTQVRFDLRPTSKGAGLPTSISAETGTMPTHERLRSDDRDDIENRWKSSIQLDEEEAISVCEVNATTHLPPQYDHLTSERGVLCPKSALRLERRDQQRQEEAEPARSSPQTLGDSLT
jgi:hypothetical protein